VKQVFWSKKKFFFFLTPGEGNLRRFDWKNIFENFSKKFLFDGWNRVVEGSPNLHLFSKKMTPTPRYEQKDGKLREKDVQLREKMVQRFAFLSGIGVEMRNGRVMGRFGSSLRIQNATNRPPTQHGARVRCREISPGPFGSFSWVPFWTLEKRI
jgi:hypothetical protein